MSLREALPKARQSHSHYFITLSRGDSMKCIALRPWALVSLLGLFPLGAIAYLASTAVFLMRDDMLAALMQRQTSMQVAYEDRLAGMRRQLDRVTSRQLLDQNSLEGKMHDLISRQAKLESRAQVVAAIASGLGLTTQPALPSAPAGPLAAPVKTHIDKTRIEKTRIEMLGRAGKAQTGAQAGGRLDRTPVGSIAPAQNAVPAGALGFAPVAPASDKPRPGGIEMLTRDGAPAAPGSQVRLADPEAAVIATNANLPPDLRIGALSGSLERIELDQVRSLSAIANVASAEARRLRGVFGAAGLDPDRLRTPSAPVAQGGPFVPVKLDPKGSLFEREVLRLQHQFLAAEKMRLLADFTPLRKPLSGDFETTSGFGSRVDPFNGRLAMHTGLDFKQHAGAPVRATGAGRVIVAGPHGGYGNMVEIDHGNGLTTRYAHLSAVVVKVGDMVKPHTMVGRLGSTGRSTGAHLHYEVRIDDAPVNPRRFIAAGATIALR